MDVRHAILLWLRNATDGYGGDLPVAPAHEIVPPKRPAVAKPVSSPAAGPAARQFPPRVAPARTSAPQPSAPPPSTPPPSTPPPSTPPPPPLDLPDELDALREIVLSCRRCKLCEGRTKVVFGEGAPRARVMFIGEAPGAREDESGRPFVGAAGQLLTRMIENAMGLARAEVFIANVNKCRPPGNRDPEPDEVAACLPYLHAQIRAIRPAVIVTLGRIAAQNLLGSTLSMGQMRGRELEHAGVPVVATWHPAYLLRQPSAKREAWEDIKRVNRLLGSPEVPTPPPARG